MGRESALADRETPYRGNLSKLIGLTRLLNVFNLRFVGFWLDRWKRKQSPTDLRRALEEVLQPLALAEIKYPIDRIFPLSDFAHAFARNAESRMGKVLLERKKGLLAEDPRGSA